MSATESSEEIVNSATKLLKNQIFCGRFEERRLIDVGKVSMYKDIVIVDKSEQEFMKTLKTVNDTLTKHFKENIITCIAGTRSELGTLYYSYSILTNLDGVTLGNHWFQVKSVSLCNDIFHIALKSLRPLKNDTNTTSANFNEYISNLNLNAFKKWLTLFLACLTVENIVSFSRFLAVLVLTFCIGCYHLLELLLRGIKEVNVFVHNITPVLVACVDGVTKIFGGLFILIAMMWNSSNKKNIPYYSPSQAHLRNNQANPLCVDYLMRDQTRPISIAELKKKYPNYL